MHDGVLQVAAETLLQHNVGVVRFNFRGVGASWGSGKATEDEKSAKPYAPPEAGDLLVFTGL